MYIISKIHLAALWRVDWRGQDGRCNGLGEKLRWQRKEMSNSMYKLLPQNLWLKTWAFIQLTLLLDSSLGLWQAVGLTGFTCLRSLGRSTRGWLVRMAPPTCVRLGGCWLGEGVRGPRVSCHPELSRACSQGSELKEQQEGKSLTRKCFFTVCWCRIGQSKSQV